MTNSQRLILASQSPRRAQLLTEAGIPFVVKTIAVEEDFPPELAANEVAAFLAEKKAEAARPLLESSQDLLLTADSTVVLDGEIFGKPADAEDAFRTLRRLSGRVHEVITGCCLLSHTRRETFSGVSRVFFKELSEAEIRYYVEHFRPYDKAGAYAIQEWIGLCKVSRIEGSYANIVGLPVDLVYERLSLFAWQDR